MGIITKTIFGTAVIGSGIAAAGTLLYAGDKLNLGDAIDSAGSSVYSAAADYTSGIGNALIGNTCASDGSEDAGTEYTPRPNTPQLNKAASPQQDIGSFIAAQPPAVQRNFAAAMATYEQASPAVQKDIVAAMYESASPAVQKDIVAAMYESASPAVKEDISVHLFADLPYDNKVNALEQMATEMDKTIYQQQHLALK